MEQYRIGLMVGNKSIDYVHAIRMGVQNTLEESGHVLIAISDLIPFHSRSNAASYFRVAFEVASRLELDAIIVPAGIIAGYLCAHDRLRPGVHGSTRGHPHLRGSATRGDRALELLHCAWLLWRALARRRREVPHAHYPNAAAPRRHRRHVRGFHPHHGKPFAGLRSGVAVGKHQLGHRAGRQPAPVHRAHAQIGSRPAWVKATLSTIPCSCVTKGI